ncbi:MAG: DUF4288 domain-containing protein [Bacteroidetes bacterium]|nr:DUF4288 domain-containing protein [Bacteroidota bacterium]
MNWYTSKIVFQIICGNGIHTPQFDSQVRLIMANTEDEAYVKASKIGIAEQDSFTNKAFEKVEWKFIAVTEISRITELKDGIEVYSQIDENDNPANYISMLVQKEKSLQTVFVN